MGPAPAGMVEHPGPGLSHCWRHHHDSAGIGAPWQHRWIECESVFADAYSFRPGPAYRYGVHSARCPTVRLSVEFAMSSSDVTAGVRAPPEPPAARDVDSNPFKRGRIYTARSVPSR